jgi:hypothetical protein
MSGVPSTGVAVDDDDLVQAVRQGGEDVLEIARLVKRWDDHGDARLG